MRCRIRAALSSTLPSLAQEHALHFQSTTPTIRKRLTLQKATLTLFGAQKEEKKIVLCGFISSEMSLMLQVSLLEGFLVHLEAPEIWEGWKMVHNACLQNNRKRHSLKDCANLFLLSCFHLGIICPFTWYLQGETWHWQSVNAINLSTFLNKKKNK